MPGKDNNLTDTLAALSPQNAPTDQGGKTPSANQPEGGTGKEAGEFVTKDQFQSAIDQLASTIDGVKRGSQGLVDKTANRISNDFQSLLAKKYANIDFVKQSLEGTANAMSPETVQSLEQKAIRETIAELNGDGANGQQTPLDQMNAAAQQKRNQPQQAPAGNQDIPPHVLSAASILEAYNVDVNDFPEKEGININAAPQEMIKQTTEAAIKYVQRKAAEAAIQNNQQSQDKPNNTILSGNNQANTPGNPIANITDPDALMESGLEKMGL